MRPDHRLVRGELTVLADPVVMPLARQMLACLEQEIDKVTKPPAYIRLAPGSQVDHLINGDGSQDECCEGLAWVRPAGFYPTLGSSPFPAQDPVPSKDGVRAWAITLELGAIRCAPVGDEKNIPTAAEWDAATQAVMDDAAAMRRAICCFIDAVPGRSQKVLVGQWEPIQIQGGCVGGLIPVTILGPACDCADAGPVS
jgi:hypothetical protein